MGGHSDSRNRAKRKKTAHSAAPRAPGLAQAAVAGERHGLFACKYCGRDVSQQVRIKCAVCPAFHLCLDCFRVGAEVVPHRRTHAYQVHGDLSFPIYALDWGADEEALLLEGVAAHGLGSWAAVAAALGTRSAEECRRHYQQAYLHSPTAPLPHPAAELQGRDPLQVAQERHAGGTAESSQASPAGSPGTEAAGAGELQAVAEAASAVGAAAPVGLQGDGGAHGLPAKKLQRGKAEAAGKERAGGSGGGGGGVGEQQLSTRGLPAAPRQEGQKTLAAPAAAAGGAAADLKGAAYELTGYHARRAEFEHEYDNDAELLISELEIRPDDPPEERAEKAALVEVYNRRLSERERRREAVVAQGLLDVRRLQAEERRQTPAEREAHAQLRVFARFQEPAEHEALVAGLLLERQLRERLQELQELRAAGVRTFPRAAEREAELRRRGAAAAAGGGDRSQRYVARTGTDDASVMSQAAVASLSDGSGRARELSRLRAGAPGSPAAPSARPGGGGGSAAAALAAWRARRGIGLDVTAAPGASTLSSKERLLCAGARLLPSQYLACKASLLREAARRGGVLPRAEARHMFRIDPAAGLRIYDLLAACGWLREADAPDAEEAGATEEGGLPAGEQASPAHSAMDG